MDPDRSKNREKQLFACESNYRSVCGETSAGRWLIGALVGFLGASVSLSCVPDEPSLLLDLRTDLVPGQDFDAATLFMDDMEVFSHVARPSGSYVQGVRLGRVPSAVGTLAHLRLSLYRDGHVSISREVVVEVDAVSMAVTIVVSRDCRGIMCPGAGDEPRLSTCVGARCVDPRCTPETPTFCSLTGCVDDAVCASHECADALCVGGACLYSPNNSNCTEGICDLERSCIPEPDGGVADAGSVIDASATDRGVVDGAGMDSDVSVDAGSSYDGGVCAETAAERDMRDRINEIRPPETPLLCDPPLAAAAAAHIADMCLKNYVAAVSPAPDEWTYQHFLDSLGIARMNTAWLGGAGSASAFFGGQAGGGNRALLENPAFRHVGIAERRCNGLHKWVVVLSE